jgi:hypothetical protein
VIKVVEGDEVVEATAFHLDTLDDLDHLCLRGSFYSAPPRRDPQHAR